MFKQLFRTALTDVFTDDRDIVGSLRMEQDGKVYRYVKNAEASTTIAAGCPVYHTFSDGADFATKVKIGTTANLGALAGITMASIAAGSYGWVQCVGVHNTTLVFASQTTVKTAGDFLKGVNAAQYADADVTMGTAPTHRRNIQLLEAVATVTPGAAAAKKVYVNAF